jgi:HD-GYP domain-containing protein (c-di-GMP phosphodiesterase class II)
MGVAAKKTDTKRGPKGYVQLSSGLLRALSSKKVAIYVWTGESERAVLFREADIALDDETVEELIVSRGNSLYVRAADFKDMCTDLLASLGDVVKDESLAPADRFQIMQMAVSFEVDRTLKAIDASKFVGLVHDVACNISELVSENELVPDELFAIARHDSQTFTHVTNVAAYATMLAEALGISNSDELHQIAAGAMLHDLGKRSIPASILTKSGRLTDEERQTIQTHPLRGYEELYRRGDVDHVQLLMVYQHHEHVDGGGYPVRICGDEIHPWSRLLSVVDVFDALTGSRPYRRPMSRSEALEFIVDRAGKQFDKEMAECWASLLKTS